MVKVPGFDFSSKDKPSWFYLQEIRKTNDHVTYNWEFVCCFCQFISALAYIAGQIEQEAKNCEDQRSMPQLTSFFQSSVSSIYITKNTKALASNIKQSNFGMNGYNACSEYFIMLLILVNLATKGMSTHIGIMFFIMDVSGTIS